MRNLYARFLRNFPSEGGAGIPPPNPLLPAPPERIRQAKRGVIFLQNTFALCLEYSTLRNFVNFSLGTSPNARRAFGAGTVNSDANQIWWPSLENFGTVFCRKYGAFARCSKNTGLPRACQKGRFQEFHENRPRWKFSNPPAVCGKNFCRSTAPQTLAADIPADSALNRCSLESDNSLWCLLARPTSNPTMQGNGGRQRDSEVSGSSA